MARQHELYFGRTMNWTDNDGNEHPESFWHLQNFTIDTDNRILYLYYAAYSSIASFESGEASLIKKGGSWTKTFTGKPYDRLIEMFAQAVAGVAIANWQIADLVKDTPNEENEFNSFFANAGEVLMPSALAEFFKK